MSKEKTTARSFAEEGLEQVTEETAAIAQETPAPLTEVSTTEEEELVQVGGLEPVEFFFRTSAPKKTPKQPFQILKAGDVIKGVFERSFTSGKFKNPTYLIRVESTGKLVGLPGTGSLNKAMSKLAEGSKVQIHYDGMSQIKNGEWAGNDSHNFRVFGNKLKAK